MLVGVAASVVRLMKMRIIIIEVSGLVLLRGCRKPPEDGGDLCQIWQTPVDDYLSCRGPRKSSFLSLALSHRADAIWILMFIILTNSSIFPVRRGIEKT